MQAVKTVSREEYLNQVCELSREIDIAHERSKGFLFTLDISRTEVVKDEKLSMVFNLRLGLNKKQKSSTEFNPFLNPSKQLLISELGGTHRLLFNKFNIYTKHLLVVTREFQPQKDKITRGDMFHGAMVCEALEGVLFFNGGDISGASQPHKHLQVLPNEARQLPIFKDIYQYIQTKPKGQHPNQIIKFDNFDFLHGIVAIHPTQPFIPLGQLLYQAYLSLYDELIAKNKDKYELIGDYNIVACDKYILMAIRKKQHAFGRLSVNSVGYLGSLLFKDQQVMQDFIANHTPSSILSDISLQ